MTENSLFPTFYLIQISRIFSRMKELKDTGTEPPKNSPTAMYPSVIVVLSIIALVATFFLANSANDVNVKTLGFSAIIAAFLVVSVSLHLWYSRGDAESECAAKDEATDRQLQALDDANEFFAGSLKPTDSFRLIASRIREMVPFRTMTLHLFDNEGMRFCATESEGPDAEHRRGRFSALDDGAIARSYFSTAVEMDHATISSRPAVAIPLRHDNEIFGILHLDLEMNYDLAVIDMGLLDAIGTRSAPMVLSSMSFEKSQTNALTDKTTELPNERAFFLVLENQVAESQRKGSSRPLTILALDVRSFDEINRRFGHASGDRVLGFVAQIIKDNLRQMDFLARASADEFVVVLPTASKEISHDVMARIQTGFFGRKLKVTESESVEIELNIGWAAFGTDGETPETLLRVARERKEQSKTSAPSKVLWFPTEFAS